MDELLDKYFTETISEAEKEALFRHIDQDESLKGEFANLQNVVAVCGMAHKSNDEQYADIKFKEIQKQTIKRRNKRIYLSLAKYAAVITLLFISWFASKELATQNAEEEFTLIEVPKGQQIHVTLADKSEVWLSSRSQLKISNRFNKEMRNIELNGEAFFAVQKSTDYPFIVKTNEYNIKVTGTQFNVFAYSESHIFETDLVEGGVNIYKKEEDEHIVLKPNEKAFVQNGVLSKTTSSFMQSQYIKNGIYSFDDKSIREIATRLELWYDVNINITNPDISDYKFSAKFRQTDDIVNILNAIKETGKFNYRIINEKEIELYE